jgi:hypothetical protein
MQMAQRLAHMVYFSLKDGSPSGIERQLAACRKLLTDHEGVELFALGTRVPDLAREVNDREFHVGLHMVFESRAAHDRYQVHPRHVRFIEENKLHWAGVRVFDADLE